MSGQVSRGSAGEYQADERAGVARLSWRLSGRALLALNLSQHQDLFQLVGSLHQVAKLLELQLQHQSFQ